MDGLSSLEAYSQLLSRLQKEGYGPSRAAEVLRSHTLHRWETLPRLPDSAPFLLQQQWDERSQRRFAAENPITRQEVAAHYLFRAGSHQQGAVRALLMERGESLVSDIVNAWLKDVVRG